MRYHIHARARRVGGSLPLAALLLATACATDAPSAVQRGQPAAVAVLATVPRTSVAAGPAAVRITVAYRRQTGSPVALGTPQQIALDQPTQSVPVSIDVAACLADGARLGTGGAPPAADECNVQLTLDFLLDGVLVDQQVLPNLAVKPGQTSTVSQPVALAQIADVRVVIPAANMQAGALRLEQGATAPLAVQVIDAGGQPVTGRPVTWSSANATIATVSETGVVTGVAVGTTTITAAVAGREVSTSAVVTMPAQLITIASAGASGRGRVVSVPAGLDCALDGAAATGSCAARFPVDASVQLTATAGANADFFAFTGDCSAQQGVTCTVLPTAARRVTVSFRSRQALTVTGAGSGTGTVVASDGAIQCTITGTGAAGQCTAAFAEGATVQLSATAASGSAFQGWQGDCAASTGATCVLTMDRARAAAPRFVGSAALTVRGVGTGAGTIRATPAAIVCAVTGTATDGTCTASVLLGTTVTLTAVAAAGSEFTGWSGACSGTGSCTVTVNAATEVRAAFRGSATLVIRGTGTGTGTVQSSPSGIACTLDGSTSSGTCATTVPIGTTLTLSAAALNGSDFAGWSGACTGAGSCTVTVNAATEVQAQFRQFLVPLSITVSGPVGGTVSTSVGLSCATTGVPVTCTMPVPFGTTVRVSASPGPFLRFGGFAGGCDGQATCDLPMTQARSISATFTPRPTTLSMVLSGAGAGSVSGAVIGGDSFSCAIARGQGSRTCTQTIDAGKTVQLSAAAGSLSLFSGWGGPCSGLGGCTFPASDITVSANFDLIRTFVRVQRAEGPGGSGQVVFGPENNRCTITTTGTSGTCFVEVTPNSLMTFTIDPSVGFPFVGWGGACASFGSNPVCTINVSTSVEVTARFQTPSPD